IDAADIHLYLLDPAVGKHSPARRDRAEVRAPAHHAPGTQSIADEFLVLPTESGRKGTHRGAAGSSTTAARAAANVNGEFARRPGRGGAPCARPVVFDGSFQVCGGDQVVISIQVIANVAVLHQKLVSQNIFRTVT